MRALVTGGAGFVGTNLIIRLLEGGYIVTSFDNYSTGCEENKQDGCDYLEIDISREFSLNRRFDVIFHLAALARIQPYGLRDRKDNSDTNTGAITLTWANGEVKAEAS